MSKRSHKSPSREKYDLGHPVVSIRVSQKTYQALEALRLTSGKSLGDILREALKQQLPSTGEAYRNGHRDGYEEAKREYAVTFKCSVCGEPIIISSVEEKTAVAQYMRNHGWRHVECDDKKGPPPAPLF